MWESPSDTQDWRCEMQDRASTEEKDGRVMRSRGMRGAEEAMALALALVSGVIRCVVLFHCTLHHVRSRLILCGIHTCTRGVRPAQSLESG